MSRFTSLASIVAMTGIALTGIALTGTAHAQSQAELAAQANDEGKELMYSNQYAAASKKFQEAVARVPEAKYFVNLCFARLQEGKYGEALTACNAANLNNPTEAVKSKADKLIAKIKQTADEQHIDLKVAGGGGGDTGVENPPPADPSHPPDPAHPVDPTRQPVRYAPVTGRPPSQNLSLAVTPDNKYTWTLGVDLYAGGGEIGQPNVYGSASTGFRIKSDYLLDPVNRIGAQGYLQVNHLNKGNSQSNLSNVSSLDIVDVGVAAYKHLCLGRTPRLCITPLIGGQIALMSPANDTDGLGSQVFNYAAVGARGELAAAYAFGYRYEHVLQLVGGVNVYSKVLSGPSDTTTGSLGTAMDVGLDKGGAVGYFGLGYTYRFNTPLGSSPFVTLE